jgi:MFS family permease
LFWTAYLLVKALGAWPAAKIAAHFGPKHGLLYANIIFAASLGFLALTEVMGIYALVLWCIFQGFAATLNNLCYLIDFSKVKHIEHAGKEIGYMTIIEKIAAGLSPLLGGLAATLFGPPAAMALSALMFLFSAIPLLRTAEQTRLNQKLSFKGYPWRQTWRGFRASAGFGADIFASGNAWVIFITAIVFVGDGSEIYAKIGLLASLGFVIVMASSYVYGRMIDHRQGLLLLRVAVIVNSLVYLLRPTVNSAVGVVASNTVNDVATTGFTMAFTRGQFDSADSSGFRIVYLYLMEVSANIGAAAAAGLLTLLLMTYSDIAAFSVFYVAIAAVSLVIATPRFMLYRH